jgi:hypothetical protein
MSAARQKRAALTHGRSAGPFTRTLKVRQLFEVVNGVTRTVITGTARYMSVGHGPRIVPCVPL